MQNLTGAQLSVFWLLGAGKSNKQIADALGRSPHTIKLHVSMILRKLKLHRRAEAAVLAATIAKRARTQRS
jgi:DNA-binding NarL/FixJ family response regulator